MCVSPGEGCCAPVPVGSPGQEDVDYIFNNLECLICIYVTVGKGDENNLVKPII